MHNSELDIKNAKLLFNAVPFKIIRGKAEGVWQNWIVEGQGNIRMFTMEQVKIIVGRGRCHWNSNVGWESI